MDPRHCRPFSDEVKTCGVRLDRPTRRCTLQRSPDRNLTECAVRERGAAGTRHGKSSGGLTAVESEEGPDRGDRCGWWSRSGPWSGWPRLLRDADAMNRKGVIERVKIQRRDGALGHVVQVPGAAYCDWHHLTSPSGRGLAPGSLRRTSPSMPKAGRHLARPVYRRHASPFATATGG